MDAATIEETNLVRMSLGMTPLPVPGATTKGPDGDKDRDGDGQDEASTLESRQAQAYDNYKKAQDAEEAKARRARKMAEVKKAREAAQRFALLEGQGLAEEGGGGEVDAKAWLLGQKKRQRKIEKQRLQDEQRQAEERRRAAAREHTARDISGVKVAHDAAAFGDGDEQILTLKDTTIDENEAEGDELENITLREADELRERQILKTRRPGYNPLDDDGEDGKGTALLGQYDDEIYGKKRKKFTLGGDGDMAQLLGALDADGGGVATITANSVGPAAMGRDDDAGPASDFPGMAEIKVKKRAKKSKSRKTRQRPAGHDDADMLFKVEEASAGEGDGESMEIDSEPVVKKRKVVNDTFVDDQDLQASLAIHRQNVLKKRSKTRPADIARQMQMQEQEQAERGREAERERENANGTPAPKEAETGLVLGDITEFISTLKRPEDDENRQRKTRRPKPAAEPSITAMDVDSEDGTGDNHNNGEGQGLRDEADRRGGADLPMAGIDQEKTFTTGIGSTLAFLRERKYLEQDGAGRELEQHQRQRSEFLLHKRRFEKEADDWIRDERDRDRVSGRLAKMSTRDREDYARQLNAVRDQKVARKMADIYSQYYRPRVNIEHKDEQGRILDQKEAFKDLSHQFHGRGSGKGKTDKRIKKIDDERRREALSITDASQGAGMSSATAQQTKKRKEAGVRLG